MAAQGAGNALGVLGNHRVLPNVRRKVIPFGPINLGSGASAPAPILIYPCLGVTRFVLEKVVYCPSVVFNSTSGNEGKIQLGIALQAASLTANDVLDHTILAALALNRMVEINAQEATLGSGFFKTAYNDSPGEYPGHPIVPVNSSLWLTGVKNVVGTTGTVVGHVCGWEFDELH